TKTPTVWWHDSANQAQAHAAFQNGAVGMTTNPFLINQTLRTNPDQWRAQMKAVDPSVVGDERAIALMHEVLSFWTANEHAQYVCAQVNPKHPGDESRMLDEARRFGRWNSKVVVKVPATNAGIAVFEAGLAQGLNMAATVSFTVSQVLAVAEAAERGIAQALEKGYTKPLAVAVLMVGRLDDYLRDVAKDSNLNITEEAVRSAGTACIKRSYSIFQERGYDDVFLMPAGCRGGYHITAISGAKMICSIAPKIQEELLSLEGPFTEEIHRDVDPAYINQLMQMDEFKKAYEPKGMNRKEFITFGSANRTLDQFVNSGWNPLTEVK
ncbi:MAG: transaldolase family protein, partial [Sphaerochaeta sp.]